MTTTYSFGGKLYQAACSCGWRGKSMYPQRKFAERDVRNHKKDKAKETAHEVNRIDNR